VIEDSFEKVHSALLCLAVGAESKEEVEEYVPSNDGLALKSKKISTKKTSTRFVCHQNHLSTPKRQIRQYE